MTHTQQDTQTPEELIAGLVRDIHDFPKPGIVFKDITPLVASPEGFEAATRALVETAPPNIEVVVGMEARGFIFGAAVAHAMGVGFVPVRKPGKLPAAVISETYDLEYGTETLEIHSDALQRGDRVLVIDDVLATGGTLIATANLLRRLGATMVHASVVVELAGLGGRESLTQQGIDGPSAIITV